jgi:hypothetical protein
MATMDARLREPFDLSTFGLAEMLRCGRGLRAAAAGCTTMEDAALGMVDYLYDTMRDPATGDHACALVRCFKTHPYSLLEPELQAGVREALGGVTPRPDLKCLTLLATAGHEPEWRDRRASRGHRAIPLASVEMVREAPMIAQLIREFGLDLDTMLGGAPGVERGARTYNVFHVPDAVGSPYIPAQEQFVVPYGIRSVLGFGGELTRGDIVAMIMFSRVPISADSASRFRNIALDVKTSVFGFSEAEAFLPSPPG